MGSGVSDVNLNVEGQGVREYLIVNELGLLPPLLIIYEYCGTVHKTPCGQHTMPPRGSFDLVVRV